MKDQYNNNIPADLTLLEWDMVPQNPDMAMVIVNEIDKLNWYCFEGNKTNHIFVSQVELEKILDGLIDCIPPEDCAFKPEKLKIVLIDRVLHRWSEGGFYHS